MRYYPQTDLFQVLLSAAGNPQFCPDPNLMQRYRKKRYDAAVRALQTRNVWLYTSGARPSTELSSVFSVYTQPAGARLILLGYATNFRYGAMFVSGAAPATVFPQRHRVRIAGSNPRPLIEDFVPSQSGVSGEPRWSSVLFPAPIQLEADEQIAVDLGYDTQVAAAPANIPPQAFVFFCVKIKQLSALDRGKLAEIAAYIRNNDYQRSIFFNARSLPAQDVEFSAAGAGGVAGCDTRVASYPCLITGIGTNLGASTIVISDKSDGTSFTLNQPAVISSLNMPNWDNNTVNDAAPTQAMIWSMYWRFPVPHLLRSGGQLHCDLVNGADAGGGAGTVTDPQTGQFIFFSGLTV